MAVSCGDYNALHGCRSCDGHGFGHAADLEDGVRAHDLVGGDLNAGPLERPKTSKRHRDLILADADELDVVVPWPLVIVS